jgi:hypothetical protein
MPIYVSNELKSKYGPAIDHLSGHLKDYAAVAVMGDQDANEIRAIINTQNHQEKNTLMTKMVERLFPGQSKELLSSDDNRDAIKSIFKTILSGSITSSEGNADHARLMVKGKQMDIGILYLPKDSDSTPQKDISYRIPGIPQENTDAERKQRQINDMSVFTVAHEIGHLVHARKIGNFSVDTTNGYKMRLPDRLEQNAREQFADKFALSQMESLASAGVISNAKIGFEYMQTRIILGVCDMLFKQQGRDILIDHTTALIDDPIQLNAAAVAMNDLWHAAKIDQPTPQNIYNFMQDLKKRDDIPADVSLVANAYINAVDYMSQGRVQNTDVKVSMAAVLAPSDPIVSKQNEPKVIQEDVETRMIVGGLSMRELFAQKAEGQIVPLASPAPDVKFARNIESRIAPA